MRSIIRSHDWRRKRTCEEGERYIFYFVFFVEQKKEKEKERKRESGKRNKQKTHQLHRHHQQQRRRHQRRPEHAPLVSGKVVCPSRKRTRRSREELLELARRERIESLASADEPEAEEQDGELDRLVSARGDGEGEEQDVRGDDGEDERFLLSFW